MRINEIARSRSLRRCLAWSVLGIQNPDQQSKISQSLISFPLFLTNQCTCFSPRMNLRSCSYSILNKELNSIELGFTTPSYAGFCYVQNKLYLAGGRYESWWSKVKGLKDFRKISRSGKVAKFQPMPQESGTFQWVTGSEEKNIFILRSSHFHNNLELSTVETVAVG